MEGPLAYHMNPPSPPSFVPCERHVKALGLSSSSDGDGDGSDGG